MNARRIAVLAGLALTAACSRKVKVGSPAPEQPARTVVPDVPAGERVVKSMYDMYAGKWYRTVTFVQKTTITLATGSPIVQTWYEAASLPGKLRIDIDEPSKGNATLYRGDSVYRFAAGKVAAVRKDMNDLLILGFDVYMQPVPTTIAILKARGFDLAKSHETTWQGKPVIVIGAVAGDTTSKQFWIEKERMLFVRLIDTTPQGRSDIRFNQYVRAAGGWIAIDVDIRSPRQQVREEYSDVHAGVALDPGLFVPETFATAKHWWVKGR